MNEIEELKIKITEIYNFVNKEFDIYDKDAVNIVKNELEEEKIEKLDKMLKDYKKAVNKAKRVQKQRELQKNYKKLSTSVKNEEFEKYEKNAKSRNMTISKFVKSALDNFINQKLEVKIDIENKKLKSELLEKTKKIENEKNKNAKLNIQTLKYKEQKNIEIENLKKEIEYLKNRNLFQRIFNLKTKV